MVVFLFTSVIYLYVCELDVQETIHIIWKVKAFAKFSVPLLAIRRQFE